MRLRRSRPDLEDPDAPARPRRRRLSGASLKKGKDRSFKCVRVLGSNWAQIVAYLVSICLFQALFGEMRQPSEYMFYKHITDLLLEAPFTDGGNQDDIFMGIGEVGDIHTYADRVMWPALLKDKYPRDEASDGDEYHAFFTPTELAVRMDTFDWTAGISFKWNRVSAAPESKCKPTLDTHHNKIFQQLWTADQQDTVVKAPRANHHGCYPDIHSRNMGPIQGDQETAPYGRNWTHPESELTHPFLFQTSAELNSNPDGQPSASVVINWGTVPTDGYAAFVIPFFSDEFLEDETKEWTEDSKPDERLADYRMFSARHSDTPKFFCVRLAWSTDWVRQLCDPNDEFGRTTGVVPNAIRKFWADLQRARWIDPFTRMVTITMPLRNNNAAIRFRLSLMMQLTSQGAVVPSYDVESRFDAADPILIKVILTITLILVIYFILLEFHELKEEGPIDYFNNMWNLMARLAPMTPLAVAQRTHAREAHSSCPLAAVAVPHAGAQDTLEPPPCLAGLGKLRHLLCAVHRIPKVGLCPERVRLRESLHASGISRPVEGDACHDQLQAAAGDPHNYPVAQGHQVHQRRRPQVRSCYQRAVARSRRPADVLRFLLLVHHLVLTALLHAARPVHGGIRHPPSLHDYARASALRRL